VGNGEYRQLLKIDYLQWLIYEACTEFIHFIVHLKKPDWQLWQYTASQQQGFYAFNRF